MGKYYFQTVLLVFLLAISTNTLHAEKHTKKIKKSGCFSFLCFFQARKLNRSEQPQENEQAIDVYNQRKTINHNDKKNLLHSKKGALLATALRIKNTKISKIFLTEHKNLYEKSNNKKEKTRILNTLNSVFHDPKSSIDKGELEELIKRYGADLELNEASEV